MDWLAYLLLPVFVGILLFRMRQDKQEFEAFKALVASTDRQRMYKKWLLESFLLFGCSSILSLLLMGQGRLLSSLYSAFSTLIPIPLQIILLRKGAALFQAYSLALYLEGLRLV